MKKKEDSLKKTRSNKRARKDNMGNVPHLPKKKDKKSQREEQVTNFVL